LFCNHSISGTHTAVFMHLHLTNNAIWKSRSTNVKKNQGNK